MKTSRIYIVHYADAELSEQVKIRLPYVQHMFTS
jgi:hypothetical protein